MDMAHLDTERPLLETDIDMEKDNAFNREPSLIDEGVRRRHDSWFGRTSTFGDVFGRENTFGRSFTEALGLNYDSEEAWTRRLMEAYAFGEEVSERYGDVPLPKGFAQEPRFWYLILLVSAIGSFIGLVAVGFMNAADKIPSSWADNGNFDEVEDCQYNAGKLYWIAITTGGGLLVGLIRWAAGYPDTVPGLFRDINDCHVEPKWAPLTFVLSAVSLSCGASLGPEQALGNFGGGIATYIGEKFEDFFDNDDRKLLVLAGMSGAMGAIFPVPLLGVLMIYELGNPPRDYMEGILVLSSSALCAFVFYYWILDYTYVDRYDTSYVLSYTWDFDLYQCGTAFLIGIVSGAIGLTSIIFIGICRQIFGRIRFNLERNKFLRNILPPVIGGLIIGSVNVALPLTIGDGALVIEKIIQYGYYYNGGAPEIPESVLPLLPAGFIPPEGPTGSLDPHLLASTAFAKLFLLGVSMNCGFIGGFVFPMILVGVIAGVMCFQFFPYLPIGFCVSCFMAAVPGSICPMPFTLACLAIFISYNGLYQTVPIYVACVSSYTLVCGSGIFTALQMRALKQAEDAEKAKAERENLKAAQARRSSSGGVSMPSARSEF